MKLKLLFHEKCNFMAIAEIPKNNWPTITILDDEYLGTNPFESYPIQFLSHYGWIEIGEL